MSSIKLILLITLMIHNIISSMVQATGEIPITNHPNNTEHLINEFKNKEYLLGNQHIIPDFSSFIEINKTDTKYEPFTGLLTIWNAVRSSQNNVDLQVRKDVPFTLIVPKIDTKTIDVDRQREFVLDHLIPGEAFSTFNEDDRFGNGNRHEIIFKKLDKMNESMWTLNGLKIQRTAALSDKLSVIYVDGILGDDRKAAFSKRNIQEHNRYNEPQKLQMKNFTKEEPLAQRKESHSQQSGSTTTSSDPVKSNHLMNFLAGMKSGTKVFQHFLTKSNLTQHMDDSPYTILIPSDNAFQRWHPIDWGFYPFSVQEFTENVLQNHFLQLKKPVRMEDVMHMDRAQKYKTLGGEVVVFKNNPTPSVNNVSILADYTLPNGNEIFLISEVLFVSEAVVSKLHQMHKDKETPPLLAFPWFGAQFLSHSFLALERDNRFSRITRFMNTAEIAPYVSGANYTFFVPIDEAFERLGFDTISDDVLASDVGLKVLLNHFVKSRLYDRDLHNGDVFQTIGGGEIKIQRRNLGNITVNQANIIESEVFVYNLGTMFYIDDILYKDLLVDAINYSAANNTQNFVDDSLTTGKRPTTPTTVPFFKYSTIVDVEAVPSEFTEQSGTDDDFLLQDDEFVTPRALPVQLPMLFYQTVPPKK